MARLNFNYNERIFHFLRPSDNAKFTDFDEVDLADILRLINQYYLEFRPKLGFSETITYGFELEFEHSDNEKISDELCILDLDYRWYVSRDKSLINGGEIASPILTDRKKDWNELMQVCEVINKNARINCNSSSHIHVGTQVFGREKSTWRNFLLLWATYENIIFRFTAGEYINPRPGVSTYALPVSTNFMNVYNTFNWNNNLTLLHLRKSLGYRGFNFDRYQAINLSHATNRFYEYDDNTVEFRSPNGTLQPIILQNNLNLFIALIKYCKSSKFDEDTILKRYQAVRKSMNIYLYGQVYLEQAIELADLIFENNLDKIYFLRQYLKDFNETEHYDDFVKAKCFIKTK